MFNKEDIVYLDGEYKKIKDANVSIMTHSLHYGSAVFEGIRAYKTKLGTGILKLEQHIDRLFYSADVMGMKIPFTKEEIKKACFDVLEKNNLESAYIRPLVFFDDSSLGLKTAGLKVRVLVAAWTWGKYLPQSVKVKISSYRRISEKSTVPDAKISGHYVNSILAGAEVVKEGYDEALLLDHNDAIAEGPGENIFFIKNGKIYTPKIGKILGGITRASIIDLSKSLDYEVIEKEIFPNELGDFEGAFFTGTAAEVTPIAEITDLNNKKYLFNANNDVVNDIKENFFKIIDGDSEFTKKWFEFKE